MKAEEHIQALPNGTKIRILETDKIYIKISSGVRFFETMLLNLHTFICDHPTYVVNLHEDWESQYVIHLPLYEI